MQAGRTKAAGRALAILLLAAGIGARAQQFVHPFQTVDPKLESALKTRVARVVAMDDAQIVALISEKAPFPSVGCVCAGGVQDTGAELWSIDDPEHVKCRYCNQTYPSEQFPLNGEVKVTNPRGQVQSYQFHQTAGGKRYFFEGAVAFQIDHYFAARAYDLARLYAITKDEKCAHKAAVILDRLAQVYPGWPVHGSEGPEINDKKFYTAPPYPTETGNWGHWYHNELLIELPLTYDLIRGSAALAELSRSAGVDVAKRIEKDLLRAAVELVRTYPRYVGASGMDGTAAGLIAIGRAIEEPDYVHDGVQRFKDAFTEWFYADGVLANGSPAYELQMLNALPDPAEMAQGYSDPPGYVHPGDGQHFENLDLSGQPVYERARNAVRQFLMPDGRYTPLHDSWARNRTTQDKPLAASHSVLFPAYGHAILGRGNGENQFQAQLHFGYHGGHAHADELNLLLFAHGKELLSDIGYTHTRLRPWAASTLAHNTVVVERLNQALTQGWRPASWAHLDRYEADNEPAHEDAARKAAPEPVFGNLLLYDATHDHVQVVEAEGSRGYREQIPRLGEYRRLIALVGVSPEDAYVVDIFRVRGGNDYIWAVHGSADEPQEVETSLNLQPQPGTLLGPGTEYSAPRDVDAESFKGPVFGIIDGIATGSSETSWTALWRYRDGAGPGLQLTMLGGARRKIALAQAPSIRPAKEDNLKVDQFKMPLLLAEAAGAESTFVAIWEPYVRRPFISEVKPLAFAGASGRAVALRVRIGDRTDYILSDPEGTELRKVAGTDISFRGRFAVVSEIQGKVQFMHLSGGTLLVKGQRRLLGDAMPEGTILGLQHESGADSFVTNTHLSNGEALRGRLMLVRQTDGHTQPYIVANVRRSGSHTLITISGESGLTQVAPDSRYQPTYGIPAPSATSPAVEGPVYRQTYFPHAEFRGGLGSFVILNSVCSEADRKKSSPPGTQ